MILWEPPPPVRIRKTGKPGYRVKFVGVVVDQGCKRCFEPPNDERHFVSLVAARRHAHSMIQEILSCSEESVTTEFDAQIWLVAPDGEETLYDAIVLCIGRHMSLGEKPGGKI